MSIKLISDFQNRLYQSLFSDQRVTDIVMHRIFFGVHKDIMSPFLVINLMQVQNLSRRGTLMYKVDFQILAYAKDNHHQDLIMLAGLIIDNISRQCKVHGSAFAESLEYQDISFDKAKDLVLNRLVINYQAFLRAGEV